MTPLITGWSIRIYRTFRGAIFTTFSQQSAANGRNVNV